MPKRRIGSLKFIIALLYLIQRCTCTTIRNQRMRFLRNTSSHGSRRYIARVLPSFSFCRTTRRETYKNTPGIYSVNDRPSPSYSWDRQSVIRCMSSEVDSTNKKTKERDEIYNELKSLSSQIREHDRLYYTPGFEPKIGDEEYDALTEREAEICKQYPDLLRRLEIESGLGSKASRVGGRVGPIVANSDTSVKTMNTGKREHLASAPMLSLENAMNNAQAIKWLNRVKKSLTKVIKGKEESIDKNVDIIAEPKLDGLSLSLRYVVVDKQKGSYKLEWGATRGDGTRGEDVTDSVREIPMIPKEIILDSSTTHHPEIFEVRGEVILPTSKFIDVTGKKGNKARDVESGDMVRNQTNSKDNTPSVTSDRLPSQFSNARNAASGILMRRKVEISKEEYETTKMLRSYLNFYAYSIAFYSESELDLEEEYYSDGIQMRRLLEGMGFICPNPFITHSIVLSTDTEIVDLDCKPLFDYHEKLMLHRRNDEKKDEFQELDFEVDGAVYKVSAVRDRVKLGSSSRYPRWAIAHKFPSQCAITRLQGVEIQVGRTGALTPVAILDPVDLGGVNVSRASLHNFEFAQTILKATKINSEDRVEDIGVSKGALVLISRAGDVIPQVLSRLDKRIEESCRTTHFVSLLPPVSCPACGSRTVFDVLNSRESKSHIVVESDSLLGNDNVSSGKKESIGQVIRCSGPQLLCKPRAVGALVHAFSRAGLDITGLSEARLQQLADAELIRYPADIFKILNDTEPFFQNVKTLNGWGEKSARNLQSTVEKIVQNGIPFSKFLYSLGIRHIGAHSSSLIASAYISPDAFFDAVNLANMSDQEHTSNSSNATSKSAFSVLEENVKGVGPVIIESLVSFAKNKELVQAAKDLANIVPIHDSRVNAIRQSPTVMTAKMSHVLLPLENKSVVFTGSIPGNMSRSEAQDYAVNLLGAKSSPSTVTKGTNIVIVGEKGGKKVEKARELGIQVMTAEEFLKLIDRYK